VLILVARAEDRGLDASDADAAVVRQQHAQDIGVVTWSRIDAAAGSDAVARTAAEWLRARLGAEAVRPDPAAA
jgi:predicted kinase